MVKHIYFIYMTIVVIGELISIGGHGHRIEVSHRNLFIVTYVVLGYHAMHNNYCGIHLFHMLFSELVTVVP